jgi:hypothetical protein
LACAVLLLLIPACEPQTGPLPDDGLVGQPVRDSTGDRAQASSEQPGARNVSAPPDLDSARAQLSWDSVAGDLAWYYAHPGDYNQDGW